MGGEGPYVQFDPVYRQTSWAHQTGLSFLDDAELEDAYRRAHGFLRKKEKELVDIHGWSGQGEDNDIDTIVFLHGEISQGRDAQLRLPLSFTSFLDGEKHEVWNQMFRHSRLFDARRQNRDNHTLFIDSLTPISDIFYLLQVLAPGMLVIVRVDEFDDIGEKETARALPSAEWVRGHETDLLEVLGSEQRYQSLVAAACDISKSFKSDWISTYSRDYDDDDSSYYTDMWGVRQASDYTACGSDCGWCGQCGY
ncbi:hypothetical protein F5887DRAFT_996687 [Amanita rubescens]|nr:hypothetical protein F5887DRAFT_996687 [Amanita rubescens]